MASEVGHAPDRLYIGRDGHLYMNGAAIDGCIVRGQVFMQKRLAQTMGAAATISDGDMLSGIIIGTPTADPSDYTTPTGAETSALFDTTPTIGDSFELTIINIAATAKVIDLTAGASGMTITGESVIENVTDGVAAGLAASGTFIFVNTAADTWIAYRK